MEGEMDDVWDDERERVEAEAVEAARLDALAQAEGDDDYIKYLPLCGERWRLAPETLETHEEEHLFCYACDVAHDPENVYRKTIEDLLNDTDMNVRYLCALIQAYYRTHVQPALGHDWRLDVIYDHLTEHVVNPKRQMQESLRSLRHYIRAYEKNARLVSPHGKEIVPDAKNLKGHLEVLKMQNTLVRTLHSLDAKRSRF